MATTRTLDVPIRAVYEDGTRVLLVNPGDVLLIGNVGNLGDPESVTAAIKVIRDAVGVRVVLFAADIDIAKVPTDA